jgi:putative ABC transport system permease protein
MFKESIVMSWKNIIHNKLRSFLTMLGIVIGVAAIIALITIVQGVIDEVDKQFDSLGANTMIVQAYGTPLKSGLTDEDVENLSSIEGVSGISPSISTDLDIWNEGKVFEKINIQGKNEVFFRKNSDSIARGRGLNILDIESKNKVCVISDDFERDVFPGEDAVGKSVTIKGIEYLVVGVYKESNDVTSVQNMLSDTTIGMYIPYKNVMSLTGTKNIVALEIYTYPDVNQEAVSASAKQVLNAAFNYKDDSYVLLEMDSLLDVMRTTQQMMKGMLVGIASISLIVGGIGIMNMMLVSVTERTTEIGLRKALGAEPGSIQLQFMIEAMFLSLLGGFVGIIVGYLISYVVSSSIGIPLALSAEAVILGFGFSAAVGIIFGSAPARKASKLNPIDALRSV